MSQNTFCKTLLPHKIWAVLLSKSQLGGFRHAEIVTIKWLFFSRTSYRHYYANTCCEFLWRRIISRGLFVPQQLESFVTQGAESWDSRWEYLSKLVKILVVSNCTFGLMLALGGPGAQEWFATALFQTQVWATRVKASCHYIHDFQKYFKRKRNIKKSSPELPSFLKVRCYRSDWAGT